MLPNYIKLIKDSLESIDKNYYKLSTADGNSIIRERVFCYELYHQMRLRQEKDHIALVLHIHGEIDKRGHESFKNNENPDFIFHTPGTHKNNKLVIEVKGVLRTRSEIVKDINKLLTFVSEYSYEHGIFILYNYTINQLIEFLGEDLKILSTKPGAKQIYVLAITSDKQQCEENILADSIKP